MVAGAATLWPVCNVQKHTAEFLIDKLYLCDKLILTSELCASAAASHSEHAAVRAGHRSHLVCLGELQ